MGFRLVAKLVTLNDLINCLIIILRYWVFLVLMRVGRYIISDPPPSVVILCKFWKSALPDKVTAVPVRRNGNFQIPISVPVVRPKRCHTLSNPAHRQDYTVACLNYTLQTMMTLPG